MFPVWNKWHACRVSMTLTVWLTVHVCEVQCRKDTEMNLLHKVRQVWRKKHLNCILFIERELRESFIYLNIHLLFYYTTESFITAQIYTFITLTCFNWYVCLSNTAFSSILSVEVLSNIESTHFCLSAWSMDKVLIEEFLQLIRPSDCRGGYIWHFWITRSLTQGLTHTGTELSRAVPPLNTV